MKTSTLKKQSDQTEVKTQPQAASNNPASAAEGKNEPSKNCPSTDPASLKQESAAMSKTKSEP